MLIQEYNSQGSDTAFLCPASVSWQDLPERVGTWLDVAYEGLTEACTVGPVSPVDG